MATASDRSIRRTPGGAGDILALFLRGEALTRNDLIAATGLARSTVAQRLEALLRAGYLTPDGENPSTGGRPANRFVFNARAGYLLVAAIGATHFTATLTAFDGDPLAERSGAVDIAEGPTSVLSAVRAAFRELVGEAGLAANRVRGIGVSVPGPVEFASGRVVSPPIMTGWDGFDIPGWFATDFDCPVLVDNDVNAMAYGEHTVSFPQHEHMLVIKVGTGIGCGIVMAGELHRGAQGAAGDLGHVQAGLEWTNARGLLCRCGNVDCVEAYASGWALVRDLRAAGYDVETGDDVVRLVRNGETEAVSLMRRAGRIVGHAVANAVSFFNPSLVVIGGQYARADEPLLAGIREVVYQRSLPLATKHLQIAVSPLGAGAGVIGLSRLLAGHVLAPAAVDREIGG